MPLGNLPASAKSLWESVYLDAKASGDSIEIAARKAWGAVKKSWKKVDGKWVKKSDAMAEMSMHITKAVMDGKVMRWAAINSDTDYDLYGERMSTDLYETFLSQIENKTPVPAAFKSVCSDFWKGGMPYVSISHYPDANGRAVPGEPTQIFVKGNQLRAKGVLWNTPLGRSVYRALQEDKDKPPEEKIRISIGFLDLAHRHGDGPVWERKSSADVCPECEAGVGDKVYINGYLVHLALTRVPVNRRTEMVLEEKSEMAGKKKTRKEDAASIVGPDLAEDIDAKARTLKSDILVEMSDAEQETEEETKQLIEEAEANPEIVEESAAKKDEPAEDSEDAKDKEDGEEDVEEKSEAVTMPYGGAVSMKEAQSAKESMEEMHRVMDLWGMFSQVAWNIMDRKDVSDKKAAFVKALDEFKSLLAAKAMVEFANTVPAEPAVVEKSDAHGLQPTLDALLSAIDNSVVLEGDLNSKLEFINPSLQELGQAITDYVTRKSVVAEPSPAPDKNDNNLLEDITKIIQPLSDALASVNERLGVLEAKSSVAGIEPRNRIPQPRSMQLPPTLTQKSQESKPKPGSLREIINRSVGIVE